jgi:hypothetical protein
VPMTAASACPASVSRRRRGACPPLRRRQGRVAGEGGVCSAVGAMEDDEPRWRTHTSRGAGEDESAAARAGERALHRPPPWPPSSSSSTAPQAGEGWMEQGRRARPRTRIRRARGSQAPNRAAKHRIELLLFLRGEREQRNEAPGRRAAAGVRREEGAACFHAHSTAC